MKKFLVLIFLISCLGIRSSAQTFQSKSQKDENGYVYETVEGDPTETRIYSLRNGMKVYLSVYRDKPKVFTLIPVRAGSKNDPHDNTGLAHYLEHMVFKGTSKIGTINYKKEKVLLDSIERAKVGTDASTVSHALALLFLFLFNRSCFENLPLKCCYVILL